MAKRIVIVGSNFAGFTAALELREALGKEHEIVVLLKSDRLLFMPSLIWVPFGLRERDEITFPLAPVYEDKNVRFQHTEVTAIRPSERTVEHAGGQETYD